MHNSSKIKSKIWTGPGAILRLVMACPIHNFMRDGTLPTLLIWGRCLDNLNLLIRTIYLNAYYSNIYVMKTDRNPNP
jgi:hypothetical protein